MAILIKNQQFISIRTLSNNYIDKFNECFMPIGITIILLSIIKYILYTQF